MRKLLMGMLLAAGVGLIATPAAAQQTLKAVKTRGHLLCGVNPGLPGFALKGTDGQWQGFDVDYCRALAAAIFNDPKRVEFKPFDAKERFGALQSGGIDVLSRNTTWTLTWDTRYGFHFGPILFYDGQGLMVATELGFKLGGAGARLVAQPKALHSFQDAKICVLAQTTSERNLEEFFRSHGLRYTPVRFQVTKDMFTAYDRGSCDVVTSDVSQLLAQKTTLKTPSNHVILGTLLSKEPLAPMIRHRDDQWYDIIKWVAFGLIQAEEYGISADNLDSVLTTQDPALRRFLGLDGELGSGLGLSADFMVRVIRHVGNYGDIFARHLRPLDLERGPNALWNAGGLLFAPPFR
jgi:general L-amino acid transport system substrate-binding protein